MRFASKDTRERAVAAYKAGGHSQQEVAAMFGIHYKTLANWLKADAEGREQVPRPKGHLKRILDPEDLARIDRTVASEPSITVPELMRRIGKICSFGWASPFAYTRF